MRGKRAKQYRKLMHQYALTFSFREPYQVLLDSSLILAANAHKMHLGSLLSSTLHGEIKPMITQCCIRHLYDLPDSPDKDACIIAAKAAERRRCGHHELEQPLSALECLESVVDAKGTGTNKNRYVVCSQDEEVRRVMRGKKGVPLIYIKKSVMIMEPMARESLEVREREERAKVRAGVPMRRGVEKRKREEDGEEGGEVNGGAAGEEEKPKKKKVKGPKGPNPLSVMKPKKEKASGRNVEDQSATKRPSTKSDSSIGEKAGSSTVTVNDHASDAAEAPKKRKRKRKPAQAGEQSLEVSPDSVD